MFSYAQAAKGKSASASSAADSSKASSGAITPLKDLNLTLGANSGAMSTMSWADEITAADDAAHETTAKDLPKATGDRAGSGAAPGREQQRRSGQEASNHESPMFGASSTSTLAKEDDSSSVPNASSESTWEEKSQASVPTDKLNERKDGATSNDWRKDREERETRAGKESKESKKHKPKREEPEKEKPAPVALKDAPIPPVNFWAQRAQEQKVKPAPQPAGGTSSALTGSASSTTAPSRVATNDSSLVKTASSAEKGSTPVTARSGSDQAGKRRDESREGRVVQSPTKAGSEAKDDSSMPARRGSTRPQRHSVDLKPRTFPIPPSVEDQMSWPTVDTIQDADKKKGQEKGDKVEAEKTGSSNKPHGKSEWIHLPYTPNVIFETPIPDTVPRRGGRGSRGSNRGRGDTAIRGGFSSSGGRNGTPNSEDNVMMGRSRGRAATLDSPSAVTSSKRRVSAGQAQVPVAGEESPEKTGTTRSKTDENVLHGEAPAFHGEAPESSIAVPGQNRRHGSVDKPNGVSRRYGAARASDQRQESQELVHSTEDNDHSNFRNTSAATQTDGMPAITGSQTKIPRDEPTLADLHYADTGDRKRSLGKQDEVSQQPPNGRHRFENQGRPYDSMRDANTFPPREPDHKPERGRGGMRNGRGVSHGYPNTHSLHSFPNGYLPTSSSSNSLYPRSPSYPIYSPQDTHHGHQSRNRGGYRAGPRSHSIPNDTPYSRHFNGYPPLSMQMPPAYMAPVYETFGMSPGSPAPYTPMSPYTVEQATLLNMISTQV